MDVDRVAELRDGPSASFLVEQARGARRVGVRFAARARRRATRAPVQPARARRARRLDAPLRQDPSVRRTAPSPSTTPRATRSSPSMSTASGARSSSVTTCASPTSSGRSRRQTDCYVVVANWPRQRRAHWSALLRARAIENQAYVVGVNRVGTGDGLTYVGDSVILDPLGEPSRRPATASARSPRDVDPDRVAAGAGRSTRSCSDRR